MVKKILLFPIFVILWVYSYLNYQYMAITKRNPGFPAHIFLADFLTFVFVIVFTLLNPQLVFAWVVSVSSVLTFCVGWLNEILQAKKYPAISRRDVLEDIVGNVIGILIAVIKLSFIHYTLLLISGSF